MPLSAPQTNTIPSLRPVGLWRALDSLSTGKALLAVWRSLLGSDFSHVQSFLQPTVEQSFTYPCTRVPWCECNHEISEDSEWEQVAICTCGDCEPFPLTRQDTMLYAFNRRAFGEALRQALGFAPPLTSDRHQPSAINHQLLAVGSHPPLHASVYFYAPTSEAALSAQVNAMLASSAGPLLLLTPTATFITPPLLHSLHASGCAHVALSTVLSPAMRPISPTSPILEAWFKSTASRPGPAMLEGIHREIAAVRHDFVELRTAKQRLEKMQADGIFSFTQKVDATSFKILCSVLAEGNIAKAARTLGISDPMMRKLLRQWRTRGPAYQAMLDLFRWRKKIGRKEPMASLNEDILHERAESTDYPALLADVLDGLLSMTDSNWQDLAEELVEVLRPVITATDLNPARPTPVRGGQ